MKYQLVLALAAVSSAFVLPSEEVLADLAPSREDQQTWYDEAVDSKDSIFSSIKKSFGKASHASKNAWEELSEQSHNAFDDAMSGISEATHSFANSIDESAHDAEAWLRTESSNLAHDVKDRLPEFDEPTSFWGHPDDDEHHGPPPHDGPPHHGPPHHKPPHHGPHHGRPNATVYELINSSKYTTKLAFFINQYPDLVKNLNSTKANYTIFAPTDRAFEKIPEHAPKPSKEELLAILSYHVVPGLYPAGRVLLTHTVGTLLPSDHLGGEPLPQRLSFQVSLRGLTVNFYSRIIAVNIIGTNGIIHGVDSVIAPPPPVIKIIDLFPSVFSTLELGLAKTGLLEKLNTTKHAGGTFFAPSNRAFAKLGPRVNAFLFSEHGLKYLKALLEYHVVPDNTLYSDAFYSADKSDDLSIPRGRFHVDLPTLLKDHSLAIDVARFGGWITIKINAFTSVAVQDGVAADGVIQVPSSVILPPRKLGGEEVEYWNGEELDVEEFKARFDAHIGKDDL